jgi:hypothetical protein
MINNLNNNNQQQVLAANLPIRFPIIEENSNEYDDNDQDLMNMEVVIMMWYHNNTN